MATIKKYYPIENRKDFYKYTILETGESVFNKDAKLHKDLKGQEMYFDSLERANEVCNAINKVESLKNN